MSADGGRLGGYVRTRRAALGWSLERLARTVGCAKSYLSMIENDRRVGKPSEALLRRLERALGAGEGELVRMARMRAAHASVRREATSARRIAALLREHGLDAMHRSGELRGLVDRLAPETDVMRAQSVRAATGANVERVRAGRRAPLVNKVAAGSAREFTDLGYPARVADEYVSAPGVEDPDAFAARVVGDSMSPVYVEGDVVVFSPVRATASGSDCFVRLEGGIEGGGETTFKRVFFERAEDGRELIRLQPLNPAHAARVVGREEVAGMYAAAAVVRGIK